MIFRGLGTIYYPVPNLHTSATIGYSKQYSVVETKFHYGDDNSYQSGPRFHWSGIGFDVSVAYDIPIGYFGTLIGTRFFYATDSSITNSSGLFEIKSLGLFVKLRY